MEFFNSALKNLFRVILNLTQPPVYEISVEIHIQYIYQKNAQFDLFSSIFIFKKLQGKLYADQENEWFWPFS